MSTKSVASGATSETFTSGEAGPSTSRRPSDLREPSPTAHDHDILTTAEGSRRLGVFVDFARAAGLASLLLEQGPFTVFAPTERAFLKLTVGERDALLADSSRLSRVMRRHIVAGHVPPITNTPVSVTSLDGDALELTSNAGTQLVGNARIVQANIPASNGTIHAIDSLLL
jgi:uncharacterized surface protein with fasciclin (FAS1) repeats